MSTPAIRVLLADDNDLFRDLLRSTLEEDFHLDIVGEAADGAQAVDLARRLAPDVVVVDLRMPGLGGDEAAAEIVLASPCSRVVIMTLDDRAARDPRLIDSVAVAACFLKDHPVEELVRVIREAAGGAARRPEAPPDPRRA